MLMRRLLIVDDEKLVRAYAAEFIPWSELGFQVVAQAADGKEALEYLHANPVDVVLTDICMPVAFLNVRAKWR